VLLDIHSLAGAGGPNQQAMVVVTYQRIQQVGVAQGISCIRNAQKGMSSLPTIGWNVSLTSCGNSNTGVC
jgi:hypothetical protein